MHKIKTINHAIAIGGASNIHILHTMEHFHSKKRCSRIVGSLVTECLNIYRKSALHLFKQYKFMVNLETLSKWMVFG